MATTLNLQEIYDENYYRANNPELVNLSSREIYQHFLTTGITEGRRFSPFFNINFYRNSNQDLNNLSNRQLLDHFLNRGLADNRKFSQFFDLDFYRASNRDLAGLDNGDLFRHFKNSGVNEKRSFSPYWDLQFYRESNPSLAGLSDQQLFENFQTTGIDRGLNFSPFFDLTFLQNYIRANSENEIVEGLQGLNNRQLFTQFQLSVLDRGIPFSPIVDLNVYKQKNPDLGSLSNKQLFQNLQTSGLDQNRKFSLYFDLSFYRTKNPDLGGLNNRDLFEHFLTNGQNEGRSSSLFFDLDFYRSRNRDLGNLTNKQLFDHLRTSGLDEGRTISPFFDFNYYRASNPVVSELSNRQLWEHFQNVGLEQGLRFSPFIDLDYYKSSNSDLGGLSRTKLLEHLEAYGLNEGRAFSPVVDLNVYRNSNPQLAGLTNEELFERFITTGISGGGGTAATQFFDPGFYRRNNPDLEAAGIRTDTELLQHFQNLGLDEGRKFSPFIDLEYYRSNNKDLEAANLTDRQLYEHFQRYGLDEGRNFSRFFDVKYYLENNPNVRERLGNNLTYRAAFADFQNAGIDAGDRPSLIFNPKYYLANNPDLLALRFNYRQAFEHFQTRGPQEGRPASIWFDPSSIAPLLEIRPTEDLEVDPIPVPIPKWIGLSQKWSDIPAGGTLTYSFVTTASAFLYEGNESTVRELTPQIKENIRKILNDYDQALGINFVEVPDRPPNVGRLRFMFSNGPQDKALEGNNIAYAYPPSEAPGVGVPGDVHLNPAFANILEQGAGSYGYQVLLRQVGRALGLKNPSPRVEDPAEIIEPVLPTGKDNNTNTVMTFNFDPQLYNGALPSTPMPYDIRALQYYYGGSYYNSGDTVYQYNPANFFGGINNQNQTNGIKQTLWDAGGNDTLDFSGLPTSPPSPALRPLPLGVPNQPEPAPPPPPIPNFAYYFDMNEGGQLTAQNALNRATYLIPVPAENPQEGSPPPIIQYTSSYATNIAFGTEIENLIGSPGNDEILGNNLANNINGGEGNDKITGARNLNSSLPNELPDNVLSPNRTPQIRIVPDTLTGGGGQDYFVFAPGDGGSKPEEADIITDFTDGQDKIALARGLVYEALNIIPTGANGKDTLVQIRGTGEYLAVLLNVATTSINKADFVNADTLLPLA